MQHNDERPPTSGRPSLLSTEQQAQTGGPRILGGLEAAPASNGAGAGRGKRRYTWLAAGVIAVVAIGAGAAMLLDLDGEKQIVLASVEPLPAAPAPAAPLASEPSDAAPGPQTANPEADEVSTAAILQDTLPAPAAPAPKAAKPVADELTKLLEHSGSAAPAAPAPVMRATPPKPAALKPAPKPVVKKLAAAKPAPAKPATKAAARPAPKPTPHALAAAPSKKKDEVHPKASSIDSDVTLLAALVAHSKAIQKKGSGVAEKLRQCKTLGSVAEAEQCRARLCAGGAKNEAECKAPRIAKASAES